MAANAQTHTTGYTRYRLRPSRRRLSSDRWLWYAKVDISGRFLDYIGSCIDMTDQELSKQFLG